MGKQAFIKNWIEYLPLTVFLVIGFWGGSEEVSRWQVAWKTSGALALMWLIYNSREISSLNRIFLGVNVYLVVGGILAWLVLGRWLEIYGGLLRGVSLFVILGLVGLLTTLFSERGYLNLTGVKKATVVKYSWILLGITIISGVMSWVFRGSYLLEGTIPFLLVYLSSVVLANRAKND